MAAELTIDDLPEEILELVFSKLSVRERRNVKLVNKQWLAICNRPKVTRDERVSLPYKHMHLFKTPRTHLDLQIAVDYDEEEEPFEPDLDVVQQQNAFWETHGWSVRTLTVGHFENHYLMLTKILNHCINIKELAIKFSGPSAEGRNHDDVFAGDAGVVTLLKSLESFTLRGSNSFATGTAFTRFTQSVPNLKCLKLEFVYEENAASVLALKNFVLQKSQNLTKLKLEGYEAATDTLLDALFGQMGPQLTSLNLCRLSLMSIDCLTGHADRFPNLKRLKLSHIPFFLGESLTRIALFRNLEFVSLVKAEFTDENLQALLKLKNLKGLNISHSNCTSDGVLQALGAKVYPNLIALEINQIFEDALLKILPRLPNLKLFGAHRCAITPTVAQSLITNCKKLTHLGFLSCQLDGFTGPTTLNNFVNLVELNLSMSVPLNVENLRLSKLKALHFGFCKFEEAELKGLLERCPKLGRVSLCFFNKGHMENFDIIRNTDFFSFRSEEGPNIFVLCKK